MQAVHSGIKCFPWPCAPKDSACQDSKVHGLDFKMPAVGLGSLLLGLRGVVSQVKPHYLALWPVSLSRKQPFQQEARLVVTFLLTCNFWGFGGFS